MTRPVIVLLLAVSLAFAGCLGGGGSDADSASADDGSAADGAAPGETGSTDGGSTDGDTTDSEDSHWEPTLEEAPPWKAGQWWTAEVTDVNTDESYTVTQVVASQHGDFYDVGLASEDYNVPVLIAHWPPIGELGTDLSYPIHNELFKPLQFPVEEGKTWETSYLGAEGFTAEVVNVDGLQADVRLQNDDNDTVTLTYDAEQETIVQLQDWLGLQYKVVDHGHGYEGDVTVPHGKSQYLSVRVAGGFDCCEGPLLFGLEPAPPQDTVDVSEPQASVAVLATGFGGAPGYYEEVVTTPGDESLSAMSTGSYTVQYAEIQDAQGTWEFDHRAGGAGYVGTEIVAYEKFTVTLDGTEGSS